MSYLIYQDYKKLIQSELLNQVIGSDLSILSGIELAAQAECISYLVQKYQTSAEFTDTTSYNPAITYKAGARVYLDAYPYNATHTYALGELTLQGGLVYVSNTAITIPEAFTRNKWIYLGAQYSIFYVLYPYPKFDLYGLYNRGDYVWYSDSYYICQQPTLVFGHNAQLQTGSNSTLANVYPNDPNNGARYWGTGTPYSVPAGSLYPSPENNYTPAYAQTLQYQYTAAANGEATIPLSTLIGKTIVQIQKEIKPLATGDYTFATDTGVITLSTPLLLGESLFILYSNVVMDDAVPGWVKGDNRNQQLVNYCIEIALYIAHKRIAPRNVPDIRVKAYDDAIKWLKMAGRGDITPDLPIIQPLQGNRIRYATSVKMINDY